MATNAFRLARTATPTPRVNYGPDDPVPTTGRTATSDFPRVAAPSSFEEAFGGRTSQSYAPTSSFGATSRTSGYGVGNTPSATPQAPPAPAANPMFSVPTTSPTQTPSGGGASAPNPYAPATNFMSPYYVESMKQNVQTPNFGGPVINPDGSVSTGMPDSWGAFGFNPFANWTGINSDTGQRWTVGDRFLNDQGALKLMELLGISGPVVRTQGAIRDWTNQLGSVFAPSSGTVGGPGGVGMYRYADPLTGQLVDLSAYAPYFISGQDDIGKFLFENRNNPTVNAGLQFIIPQQFTNVSELQAALQSAASSPAAQGIFPQSTPTGVGSGGTGSGGTGSGSGTGNSPAGNRSAIDSFIQLLQGIYQGSNPFTIQNFNATGNLGTPGAPFGQDYLDGLKVISNFANLGDQITSLLTPKDLFDVSPTGMYANFGPAAYLQRALYPEFYM